jgi:hypothetical protein
MLSEITTNFYSVSVLYRFGIINGTRSTSYKNKKKKKKRKRKRKRKKRRRRSRSSFSGFVLPLKHIIDFKYPWSSID